MGSISGEEIFESDASQDAQEEKIFVAVRMRPLNDREIAKNDVSDWECINNTTIIFKNTTLHERALPTAYTFDRVFGCDSPTRQVYGEAAKKIALSVLSGMNSTIFAYGQTSSGKTFTMSGVTEYAVEDIYEYIRKHTGREFVLRFSAMEIYNELVRDLLSTEGIPLRLLDDPERGTVVDKLTEVTLTDLDHLKELLSVCEAQRQIGETSLNEVSSRSHQILRLTVESEAREFFGAENSSSLTASVNFVDLAGSERASQTSSAGTRLKEGCHINRSLLTLGTVIRKLSKGRNTHIPYRDSKLTRILQSSLGGNARTAIICTMSPAHTHVEQSRNTLLFASCAKQISTNAQVNVVMSEKALVKQLQRELARLENELKNVSSLSNSSGSSSTLREKELLIEKMEKQIQDLTNQRDLAHSRVQDMIRSGSSEIETPKSWNQTPKSWNQTPKSWIDTNHHNKSYSWSPSEASEIYDPFRSEGTSGTSNFSDRYGGIVTSRVDDQSETNEEQFLSDDTSPRQYIDKYFGPDPCKGWEKIAQQTNSNTNYEDNVKEVKCIEVDIAKRKNVAASEPYPHLQKERGDHLSVQSPGSPNNDTCDPSANVLRSNSCAAKLTTDLNSPSSEESQNTLEKETNGQAKLSRAETVPDREIQRRAFSLDSINSVYINVVGKHNITISQDSINSDYMDEEQNATKFIKDSTDSQKQACTKEPNEDEVTEAKSVKHDLDMEEEKKRVNTTEEIADTKQSGSDWAAEFERQRREIIKLWDACHIPLVHRTYFFLLFQGDPSDAVYMEVELRRLSFLKSTINGKAITFKDQQFGSQASRAKALHRERETLCKKMMKKFSEQDREALYERWDIDVSSKQRRLQLARKLWTNTTYMEHVKESAAIVAKLEGFQEPGKAPKEMFGLSFSPRPASFRSFSWRQSLPSIV